MEFLAGLIIGIVGTLLAILIISLLIIGARRDA